MQAGAGDATKVIDGPTIMAGVASAAVLVLAAIMLHKLTAGEPPDCPICGALVGRRMSALQCDKCGWRDFGP